MYLLHSSEEGENLSKPLTALKIEFAACFYVVVNLKHLVPPFKVDLSGAAALGFQYCLAEEGYAAELSADVSFSLG